MTRRVLTTALAWLLAIAAILAAAPAAAEAPEGGYGISYSRCFADGAKDEALARVAIATRTWACGQTSHSIAAERVYILFRGISAEQPPRYFETRRTALSGADVLAAAADGEVRVAHFAPAEFETSRRGGFIRLPLPTTRTPVRAVIVALDDPTHRMAFEQAQLVPEVAHDVMSARRLLLALAALCGMLLMPLMFNAAFYRILHERFVLWHSALAVTLLLSIVVSSGLAFYAGLPVMVLNAANTVLFGLSVGAAGMFARSFIEPGKLHPLLRRALPAAGAWAVIVSTLHAGFPFALRPIQSTLYYWAYTPVLAAYLGMLADALRRGSRAARFQAVGWAPMIAVCFVRLISGLVPSIPSADGMLLFYAGCVVEVLATTLGVADRFMILKDERDRARTEARVLESLSERDALTGLFNRRVIEDRFARFRAEGFTTLAVIDLDHFKQVNDLHGHATGDEVLRVVAAALEPNDDTLVLRMGGEEFLLLLRGRDALQRAEMRRRAITLRVTSEIPGLGRPLTASMGIVEVPAAAVPNASFAELYARADQLLYEAKQAGRNRTMSERLKAFAPRRKERRRRAA